MKPLFVLAIAFGIAALAMKIVVHKNDVGLSARIAMSAMLLFTSIGHFVYQKGMTMMVPDVVPFKTAMVYLTGFFEMAAAAGLLVISLKITTGWALIIFFIVMLPANINAAIKHVDYQKGTFNGSGINYLWFRVPLQIVFIVWVYVSAIRF